MKDFEEVDIDYVNNLLLDACKDYVKNLTNDEFVEWLRTDGTTVDDLYSVLDSFVDQTCEKAILVCFEIDKMSSNPNRISDL